MGERNVACMYSYEAGKYLTHLIRCSLNDQTPVELSGSVSWDGVFQQSRWQSVENLAFHSVKKLQNKPEGRIFDLWQELSNKSLVKEVSFNVEREKMLSMFEKQGIKYLPLKGIILKDYYPVSGMRIMADNDILYDKERQEEVLSIMRSLGYSCKSLIGNHDVYYKKPILNFELHRSLMAQTSPYYEYFEKAWDRAIKDEENDYGYHMNHEDFYIYLVVHFYKHYEVGGSGIRSITDLYVFLKKFSSQLDFFYINAQLDFLGLKEFEDKMSSLAFHIYEDKELSSDEEEELAYLLQSGVYGSIENAVNNIMKERENVESLRFAKIHYLWKRLIPDMDFMKSRNPILNKYPVLYPFLCITRMFNVFSNRATIKSEAVAVKNYKDEQ